MSGKILSITLSIYIPTNTDNMGVDGYKGKDRGSTPQHVELGLDKNDSLDI